MANRDWSDPETRKVVKLPKKHRGEWFNFVRYSGVEPTNNLADRVLRIQTNQVLESKRDHCKRESSRWRQYNQKLRKMRRKLSNQLRDYQHKLPRKIVENTKAKTIIIGKLDSKKMAEGGENKGLNRSLQNTGTIGRFARFLAYKAELVGKKVIEIGEEGTTKTCCVCGRKEDRPLHERTIKCDCGNGIDRDRNSAVNILIRFLSQERLVDGLLFPKEGMLRQALGICIPANVRVLAGSPSRKLGIVHFTPQIFVTSYLPRDFCTLSNSVPNSSGLDAISNLFDSQGFSLQLFGQFVVWSSPCGNYYGIRFQGPSFPPSIGNDKTSPSYLFIVHISQHVNALLR